MSSTLVIAAHPQLEHSRITRTVLAAIRSEQIDGLAVTDLYARYPDYFIDVAAEQRDLTAARNLVWLHPIHWYSMPPLMKLWLDEVFAFGWAYGPGGTALEGKRLWLVTSTGGGAETYTPDGHHHHRFEDFLLPYEQTAKLTGMCMLPPQVLHAAHRVDDAMLAAHVKAVLDGLHALARGDSDALPAPPVETVSRDERPSS